MQVNAESLSLLKCSECNCHLSRTPIYINLNGSCICGRCPVPEEGEFVRMLPYEKLAEEMKFPCQYQQNGCAQLIPFKIVKNHEENCKFRTIICPILPTRTCDWLGFCKDLLDHCKLVHSDHVVQNPCTLEHSIKMGSETNYLTNISGELFLIHTKVCVSQRKIYYSVRFIGGKAKIEECNFDLDIERNGQKLPKKGSVTTSGSMAINKELSVEININSLIEYLGGYDGTTFTVAINYVKQIENVGNTLKFNENPGDIFTSSKKSSLAICVAEDMLTNADITKYFRAKFGKIANLLNQNQKTGGLAVLKDRRRYIYYLVTVELLPNISTLDKVRLSLEKLKKHCLENHVKKLAISKISFEFDWNEIRPIFEQLFQDVGIEIEVYESFLPVRQPRRQIEQPTITRVETSLNGIKARNDIGLIYFTSEDGYLTKQMQHLSQTFNISSNLTTNLSNQRRVGYVQRSEDGSQRIYGLTIRKTKDEQVDFRNVVKCIKYLRKLIKRDKSNRIAFEAFQDQSDPALMEKIVSVIQYVLHDVEVLIYSQRQIQQDKASGSQSKREQLG